MKMKKGSYTVEAALLMGILIPLLTGVIYLGFFMELRGQVQAEAMEKALTGLLTEEEAEGVSLGKKEISAILRTGILPVFCHGLLHADRSSHCIMSCTDRIPIQTER